MRWQATSSRRRPSTNSSASTNAARSTATRGIACSIPCRCIARPRSWRERAARGRRSLPQAAGGRDAVDIGEIAVIQDEGDLIAPPNPYDLRGLGLRFTRNSAGGYDVRRITSAFRTTLGRQLTLGDDDSASANVAFSFNFYGRGQTIAFVNSDGNVTFEQEDRASTDRNVARLLTGPPRVSPFLADLDPSTGGRVFVNAASDQYTVTWCAVRGFESTRTITTQLTLLPDGSIEMQFIDASLTLPDAVVGVSPGRTGEFRSVNLSDQGPSGGGSAAVGERFAAQPQLDTVAVSRKFYATHPDNYDQVVVWTDAALVQDAFAFEQTVANEVGGIGVPIFDASREFGSAGRLRSTVIMDWLGKYPDDPAASILRREQHAQHPRPGIGPPLARVHGLPRSHRRALRSAPRPRPGALELLLRLGCVGHGRQRYRRPRRRVLPYHRRRPEVQPPGPVRDGPRSAMSTCRRSSTSRTPRTCR